MKILGGVNNSLKSTNQQKYINFVLYVGADILTINISRFGKLFNDWSDYFIQVRGDTLR
jgi:hypothetical protein